MDIRAILRAQDAEALTCENTRAEGCCPMSEELQDRRRLDPVLLLALEELKPKESDPSGVNYSKYNYWYCPACEAEGKMGKGLETLAHKPDCGYITLLATIEKWVKDGQ